MTDLHTHILPGIDDGARDVEVSLAMLRLQRANGVDTVALTPHFYRNRERPESFLKRREGAIATLRERIESLSEEERAELPHLIIGAEVAWSPNMSSWSSLDALCYENSRYLLLELPFQRTWTEQMLYEIYDLMSCTGFIPVIAHIERYIGQQKKELIEMLLSMGLPVQISSEELLHPFRRGKALKLIKNGQVQFLTSDCHNCEDRAPNMGEAVSVLRRKLGETAANELLQQADVLLSDTTHSTL